MAELEGPQVPSEIVVNTADGPYTLVGRPCEVSAFSFVPTKRLEPSERTVFNNSQKDDRYSHSTYDRLFHQDYGFNNKLHRCDREHAKSRGLNVNDEEAPKDVPTLASSEYGHRLGHQIDPPVYDPKRKNVRIGYVQSEFFRRNIWNIKPPEGFEEL